MDREAGKPMEFDAIFRIYSMTKPITSTAVMMLFEEGFLRLTDPVSSYIPAFKDMKVYHPRGNADYDLIPAKREITIHDLLTHTAGLSYGFDEKSPVDEMYRTQLWKRLESDPSFDLEKAVDTVAHLPLANQPGEIFRYSFSIDVLGRLVEVVSGQTLDTFLKERIFGPLGMPDTDFYVPLEKHARLTAVYGPEEKGGIKVIDAPASSSFKKPAQMLSGGGGLVSTAADYLRFAQMILNHGELDGQRLLGRKTVEFMLLNHLPEDGRRPDEPFSGFGLGGSVMRDVPLSRDCGSLGEWGWGGAANTWFWIDPLEKVIGIIMMQYMPAFVLPVTHDYKNMVYQALVD
jgi:CubicO group peptidase (beta-lactamase class C family)